MAQSRLELTKLERVERNSVIFYRNNAWGKLAHGIFTRHGGVSASHWKTLNVGGSNGDDPAAVAENHRRMYRALDIDGSRAVTTWLVHSVDAVVIDSPPNGDRDLPRADGMITNLAGIPLVMRFADCVPLLYYDPVARAIGLGHAGWRGTVQGMAGKMVQAMRRRFGSNPADIEVVIGPAISRRNYQVGEEVAAAAKRHFGDCAELVCRRDNDGSAYLDLWLANRFELERHGVTKIELLNICTFDNHDDFFSHRAERGRTGRFGVVLSL